MNNRIERAKVVAAKLLRGNTTGDTLDDFACALLAYEGEHPGTLQLAGMQELLDETAARVAELEADVEQWRQKYVLRRQGYSEQIERLEAERDALREAVDKCATGLESIEPCYVSQHKDQDCDAVESAREIAAALRAALEVK